MNKKELEDEIFSCEDWGIFNRIWFDQKIEKSFNNNEITIKEKVELFTLIADEMEIYENG